MTNLKYVEEVMNSNMSADAMAMALSTLVDKTPHVHQWKIGSAQNKCPCDNWFYCLDGFGAENAQNILDARMLMITLPMLQDTKTGVRAKDIAKVYNDTFKSPYDMTYYDTKHILLKLLDCGIVKYENREEKVEIVDRRGLKREILTRHRVYFLNI